MTEVITYEILYENLRKEKYKKELQHLEKEFYKKVKNYIQEKKDILRSQENIDSPFSNQVLKLRKQIENIQKMLKEFYERRESKIIQLALFSSRTNKEIIETSEMIEEEINFYKEILRILNNNRKKILFQALEDQKPKEIKTPKKEKNELPAEKNGFKKLKFNESVPKFVGEDLKTYGPFKQGDKANIPEETANLLLKTKKAEEE